MTKKEFYRQIYFEFRDLCSQGLQTCSFSAYCRSNGVKLGNLRSTLGDEFKGIRTLEGFKPHSSSPTEQRYMQVYLDYKELCGKGEQPGSFKDYCECQGCSWQAVYQFLWRRNICITGIQGYENPLKTKGRYQGVPFEEVIFEESGFLPAEGNNVITVQVDGHVSVSFPSDTDVDVVAEFVRKLGKEVSHVGS